MYPNAFANQFYRSPLGGPQPWQRPPMPPGFAQPPIQVGGPTPVPVQGTAMMPPGGVQPPIAQPEPAPQPMPQPMPGGQPMPYRPPMGTAMQPPANALAQSYLQRRRPMMMY